mmetsp:Transcript_95728/g.166272  ORF Transcript_95728/g.166272 Transcript_95728/m.166272 type:complete len:554 (-) Transcript_95728:113-1774(-)
MEERGYKVIRCLGQGGQSRVYEVTDKRGKLRVVKQLPWMGEHDKEVALREVRLLSSLRHPCIVPYLESFLVRSTPSVPTEDLLCLVMSRCERDLREACLERRECGSHFEEPRILTWLVQLCWGLQHLHARKFLHRDLKPQNVLLTQSGRVLLADFGVAGHLEHTEDFRRSIVGTPAFMSPEMLEGRPYGCETDQWALGCVLYEIMALEPPFANCESYAAVVAAVLHSPEHIKAPNGYSPELAGVVEALLHRKPHERPSNTELLRGSVLRGPFHAFLQSLEAAATASTSSTAYARANASSSVEPMSGAINGKDSPLLHRAELCAARGELDDETPRTRLLNEAEVCSYASDFEEYSPASGSPEHHAPGVDTCELDGLVTFENVPALPASSSTSAPPVAPGALLVPHADPLTGLPGCSQALLSFRSDLTTSTRDEDIQEISANVLGNAGVGAGEWRQLLAEAESLLQPPAPERIASEEVAHVQHVRAALCDLLGTEAQVSRAIGFLRERRPLDETVEADELLLQVEVLDLLGDDGLRALPLLERLMALEDSGVGMP